MSKNNLTEQSGYRNYKVRKGDIVAVLHYMETGYNSVGKLSEETEYSKQKIHFILNHLIDMGVVHRYDWGKYVIKSLSSYRSYFTSRK